MKKKLYWRPRGIPSTVLALIALVSLLGMLAVEVFQIRRVQPDYTRKLEAAQLAQEGMEIIKEERLARGATIDPEVDPAGSGLVGLPMSSVTTVAGQVAAKQTSINPNFAAVVVEMLSRAGVKKGDVVAVGASGSFPALNICVYAALRTLELQPIIISSASASQFGANDPDMLWIDMERILNQRNPDKFPFRSVAASLGGVEDCGLGMSKAGKEALLTAVERNALPLLQPKDFADSIQRRMVLYLQKAGGRPIKAYINVGGGTISVGTAAGKRQFNPGLNLRRLPGARKEDSVMTRFIDQEVPVIHLSNIAQLARQYGLPVQPKTTPPPGEGRVFYRDQYNPWLAAGVLFAIVASLYAFVRSEVGYRILRTAPARSDDLFHEPMV